MRFVSAFALAMLCVANASWAQESDSSAAKPVVTRPRPRAAVPT